MLFYLLSADELRAVFARLGYRLDRETIPKTVKYYLARTSHGSTLSAVVHAWVLARSDRLASWRFSAQPPIQVAVGDGPVTTLAAGRTLWFGADHEAHTSELRE
jgi:hypothetical protein